MCIPLVESSFQERRYGCLRQPLGEDLGVVKPNIAHVIGERQHPSSKCQDVFHKKRQSTAAEEASTGTWL